MRGYLAMTLLAATGACITSTSQTPNLAPVAHAPPAVPAALSAVAPTYILVAQPSQPSDTATLALQSHPSFMYFIEDFPGAYMRDACLREGWDRPVTIQKPYTGDARDHLAQDLRGRLIELEEAETKWQAIQEKHNALPEPP